MDAERGEEFDLLMVIWSGMLTLYRAKIVTVEVVAFLFILGKALYIPLCEQYYYHRFGADLLQNTSFVFPNGSFCVSSELIDNYTDSNSTYKLDESFSNYLVAYTQIASAVPSVVATLIIGPLTDRYGRKLGIILPTLGTLLQSVLSILIVMYSLHPYYFILANFISGVTGGFTSLLAASFSYIADIGTPRWRSLRIGIIEAGLAFGSFSGHLIGGYWLDKVNCNYVYPLIFVGSCYVLILIYTLLLVPESLTSTERDELLQKNPSGFGKFLEGFKLFCGGLPLPSTWKLYVATIATNLAIVNMFGADFVDVYFLKALPFDFNAALIGIYQSLKSASQGISNLLIMGVLVGLKVSDSWVMLIAYLFHITCNVLTGLSTKGWQLFAIASVKGVEGIVWSGARGLMSKLVKPQQQGAVFAMIASVETLATLLASVVWPLIFPLTLLHNMRSGTTYLCMAALGFLVLPLLISLLCMKSGKVPGYESSSNDGEKKHLLAKDQTNTAYRINS